MFIIGIKLKNNKIDINKKNIDILYVGRIEKVKGIHILIKAISLLKDININVNIIGDGRYFTEIQNLVNNLELNNSVKLLGRKNDPIYYMERAKIFVYPSIWEEAFGISVVEAMEQGCICIAFKKGGIPEIIDNTLNGYIINEVSEKLLAYRIKEILANYNNKIYKNLRIKAINTSYRFSIENTINNLKNEYEKLMLEDKWKN